MLWQSHYLIFWNRLSMTRRICAIFKSPRREGMYLYVDKAEGLARVPQPLLERFGKPAAAMTLLLESSRKLARVDVAKVLQAIAEQGFYLQMPAPDEDDYMREIQSRNSKL